MRDDPDGLWVAEADGEMLGFAFSWVCGGLLKIAAETGASQVSAFLPGVNDATLSIAAAHGMRITFPMVLVSAREFGDWTRYLPRNPGFM